MKTRISTRINKSNDIVYQAFINPDNMLKWSTDLEKFEIIKGKFGEIGATARLHYNQKGRKHTMEDRLEYIDPGRKIISRVSGEGMVVRVEINFSSINDETEIEILWNGTGSKLLLKIILPFLRGMIRNRAQAELDKFKSLVETQGINFKS